MHSPISAPRQSLADLRLKIFSVGAILLPICFFYGLLARHTVNIPFGDDYDGVLGFLEHFSHLPTFFAKLNYIASAQHNEYKPMFANLIIALQYKFSGHPDFGILSWLGNGFVAALFFLLWRYFLSYEANLSRRLLLFVPISFILFQLQYAETLNWSMPGLQNIPVLVFAFACVAFLSKEGSWSFLLSCIFMALSIASSGNGFALVPIGIVIFLSKREQTRTWIWIVLAGLCGTLYFHQYNFHSSQQIHNGSVLNSIHYVNPIFALSFMGAALGNDVHLVRYTSVVLGAAILVIVVLMVKDHYYKTNPTIFFFTFFLVFTAIAVSGIRSKLGFSASYSGRYKIYSDLLLICCYAFLLEKYKESAPHLRRRCFRVALISSVLFCAFFDRSGNKHLTRRQNDMIAGATLYEMSNHQRGPVMFDGDDSSAAAKEANGVYHEMIQDAESTGLYRFP